MCNYSLSSNLEKLNGVKACAEIHQHVPHTLSITKIRMSKTYISFPFVVLAVRLDPVETKSVQKRRKTLNRQHQFRISSSTHAYQIRTSMRHKIPTVRVNHITPVNMIMIMPEIPSIPRTFSSVMFHKTSDN